MKKEEKLFAEEYEFCVIQLFENHFLSVSLSVFLSLSLSLYIYIYIYI